MSDPDTILLEAEDAMSKAEDYLGQELRGIRTGRASTALVDFIKVDYYGSSTELKSLASITIPEPTQILVKPFDAGSLNEVRKAIENSGLSLNPQVEGKQIRLNVPPLTGEQRKHLVTHAKKMGEQAKVVLRNARRDANKHADALSKSEKKHYSEDEISTLKDEIQELLKKYEANVDKRIDDKTKEITEI